MRKITNQAVNAFYNESDFNLSNTDVYYDGMGGVFMRLHGNLIAEYNVKTKELKISDAGWRTNTTKERLNGVLPRGMYIKQKNFQWFLYNELGEFVEFKEGNSLNGVTIF